MARRRKGGLRIVGEKFIGTSVAPTPVKPQLIGDAVEKFKRATGVCLAPGCHKIAGHGGPHS